MRILFLVLTLAPCWAFADRFSAYETVKKAEVGTHKPKTEQVVVRRDNFSVEQLTCLTVKDKYSNVKIICKPRSAAWKKINF